MPAINVARTDTFEQQRLKINQIGDQIFNITAGGSDLSTGNLKLGDGTRQNPSLAFVSDPSLGIYKPSTSTLGFVSNSKKIFDIADSGLISFKNFTLQKKVLTTNGVSITNPGFNYDPGIYTNIDLLGGTGSGAIASVTIGSFAGTVIDQGSNYKPGSYNLIPTVGGSGTPSSVSFIVDSITGSIQTSGSGYPPGSFYDVPITGGSGAGALADITIVGQSTISGSISSGSGYSDGTYSSIEFLNAPTATYSVSAVANPSSPPPTEVFSINGTAQQTLNLTKGNTYKFDLSDVSLSGHTFVFETASGNNLDSRYYTTIQKGILGSPGSSVYLIIDIDAPSESIRYDCSIHNNMGGTINITSGSVGRYGKSLIGEVVVSSGAVTGVTFSSTGEKYKLNDIVEIYSGDIGGSGSGFSYTINSITYNGEVQTITFTSIGSDYLRNDLLSFNNLSVGGFGSGFQFRISSQPGKIRNLEFIQKGSGYSLNDIISIPGSAVSNISTVLQGELFDISATLDELSPIVTLSSTSGIVAGMEVINTGISDVGFVGAQTTVLSVDSGTQITLSTNPVSSGLATLYFRSPGNLNEIIVASTNGILVGSIVSKISGNGVLSDNTTVSSVDSQNNIITLSSDPVLAGGAVLSFEKPYGSPTTNLEYRVDSLGSAEFISILEGGTGYSVDDILTIRSEDLTQPIRKIVTVKSVQIVTFSQTISSTYFQVGDSIEYLPNGASQTLVGEIYYVKTAGSNLVSIAVDPIGLLPGTSVNKVGDISTYSVDTSVTDEVFFIDDEMTPSLTLYVGSTYEFDISDFSNQNHGFSLSEFRDGIWEPSYIQGITTNLSNTSNEIIVSDPTGIVSGMEVTTSIGSSGLLDINTKVVSIVGSTITLDKTPLISGSATLTFRGTEYLTGVEKTTSYLRIKIISTTPSLYYYCSSHPDESGIDLEEPLLIVDQNNPKIFGSNLEITATSIDTSDIIKGEIQSGDFSAEKFIGSSAEITTITSETVFCDEITTDDIVASNISSGQTGILNLSASSINLSGFTSIGSVTISNTNGNISTNGEIKTNNSLNIADKLIITDTNISSTGLSNIDLSPASGRLVKINSSTALTIPSGSTSERPSALAENGSIRFNTQTNQYEGYSATTSSWSSLGGVRDLDGNTYITAEESIGSNDNTLWFYNDNINTVKFTPTHLEFANQKSIRSSNVNSPSYTLWSSNTPVSLGQYLKYRNNLYEVTVAGITATSGSEPTHTTGSVANGTAELTWHSLAVSPLTFEDIEVLRIGPLGSLPVSINNDLRLADNTVSTDISDLVLRPNSGKKVIVDAPTSFVIPSGQDSDRGIAIQGSIRFSQTSLQFEGYDGTNWGSLGGVKDVDQNTYIIPELSPGSNENILYFYNDNNNTLQLTTTSLDFYSIDTIRSATTDELEITASLLTFDNGTSTFDNTATDRTFLHTTKQYFDLGLSAGLTSDPVLRLDDQGDVYLNIGFGTGVYEGVKVFDGDLKEFELADVKILTEKLTLVKGTSNNGSSELYAIATNAGCKTTIVAVNPTSGDKEFIEFGVLDDGIDVFYTEYGNIRTGTQLVIPSFEVTGSNVVRINIALGAGVNPTESVNITVVSNVTKK